MIETQWLMDILFSIIILIIVNISSQPELLIFQCSYLIQFLFYVELDILVHNQIRNPMQGFCPKVETYVAFLTVAWYRLIICHHCTVFPPINHFVLTFFFIQVCNFCCTVWLTLSIHQGDSKWWAVLVTITHPWQSILTSFIDRLLQLWSYNITHLSYCRFLIFNMALFIDSYISPLLLLFPYPYYNIA